MTHDLVGDFTDEQRMLRSAVRDFATDVVAPLAHDIDRHERFPRESWEQGAALGILGICAPEEYGGTGLGLTEMCIAAEELSAVCVSTAATLLHQADLVIGRFVRHGTDKQKAQWLPSLCDGSVIGCLAITEPDAGSDAMSMRTSATPVDDGYLLNGSKMFITNGPVADIALVYARISGVDRHLGLFIVEDGTPGFEKGPPLSKMGWRGSATGPLFFQDCFVPAENLIGDAGGGRDILFAGLNSERIVLAAESVGLTRGALDAAVDYANKRQQFGRPIASFQLIQEKIADAAAELFSISALVYRAAELIDRHLPLDPTLLASSCKLLSAELCMQTTMDVVQVFGGYGYIDEYPVERYMRDAKLMQIGGGTSEIMRTMIARRVLRNGY